MPGKEAGPRPPLLNVQALRAENGPPLPLAGRLRRSLQLQSLSPLSHLSVYILLGVLRRVLDLGLE